MSRAGWRYDGRDRPPFAVTPRAGEESVWDYPRPPRLAPDAHEVVVRAGSVVIARTTRALRVLETASPPTFYLPPEDVRRELLEAADGTSWCEWKGAARYWDVVLPDRRLRARGVVVRDAVARLSNACAATSASPAPLECFVAGVRVTPAGRFYAGWVTPRSSARSRAGPGSEER
jgi:uncharacterized protein (DUF427 family)